MSENENVNSNNNSNVENEGQGSPLQTDLQKAHEEAEKYKNDFLYLRAEFENYKRNSIKERSDLTKYGAERFIRDFLEIMDNFERALSVEVTPENYKTVIQGVQMTTSEIKSTLGRHGVQEVVCQGAAFDPTVHEALSSEATTEVPAGHILRVFKKAYKLHDKLIRPAQVIVAKQPE